MAPTITRRKRKVAQQEDIPESIFDALNASSPGGGTGGEPTEKREKTNAPTIADLQAQLAAVSERLDRSESVNIALTTAAPKVEATQPQPPKLDLENLPDPVDNPKGYAEQLAKRTSDYNLGLQDYYQSINTTKANAAKKADATKVMLWNDFVAEYGDYAQDSEGVEFVTRKVVQQLTSRGLDAELYMQRNPDRFFKDIVKAYDKRFGKPEDEEGEDDPTPVRQPRKAARQAEEDSEPNRTGGIFGGHDGTGSGSARPSAPPAGDMVKDLQDLQRKTGYY